MLKKTIVAAIILGFLFLLYSLFNTFDPNYNEFGVWVSFYESEDCVDFDTERFTSGGCYLFGGRDGVHKKYAKSLGVVVENIQKRHRKIEGNQNYLEPQNGWACWIDNRYIDDLSSEVVAVNDYYKCWPKSLD